MMIKDILIDNIGVENEIWEYLYETIGKDIVKELNK